MKITDSDGWITVSIPREDAEELIEALVCGARALDDLFWHGSTFARPLDTLVEGIRAAIESARKGLDISDPPS